MLLSRKYRDRAIGLVAAYAVLVTGVVVSAEFDRSPAKRTSLQTRVAPRDATNAVLDRSRTKRAVDCFSALECRSEIVC